MTALNYLTLLNCLMMTHVILFYENLIGILSQSKTLYLHDINFLTIQKEDKSVDFFITNLKNLAKECSFEN